MYDGVWNSVIYKNGRAFRERVEILVLDNKDRVFIGRKSNGEYTIPGGSTEPDVSWEKQVIAECQEEALFTPKNLKYAETYERMYGEDFQIGEWMKTVPCNYVGTITHLFIGEYGKPYRKYVAPKNRSAALAAGKFVDAKEIEDELIEVHRKWLVD